MRAYSRGKTIIFFFFYIFALPHRQPIAVSNGIEYSLSNTHTYGDIAENHSRIFHSSSFHPVHSSNIKEMENCVLYRKKA